MKRTLAALAVLLACASPAVAHQLDAYLQTTRIAIAPDRVELEINLTPGVAVADQIFAAVDRDRDGAVSPSEIAEYGRRVLQDLRLDVDGRSLPLTLVRAESPAWPEMRDGVGTIRLTAAAAVAIPYGRHQLRFANDDRPDIGVYLVNALKPSSRAISIGEQQRDVRQRDLQLQFDRALPYASAAWIVFPLLGLGAIVLSRRRVSVPRRGESGRSKWPEKALCCGPR